MPQHCAAALPVLDATAHLLANPVYSEVTIILCGVHSKIQPVRITVTIDFLPETETSVTHASEFISTKFEIYTISRSGIMSPNWTVDRHTDGRTVPFYTALERAA